MDSKWATLWRPVAFEPVPWLAELRRAVLERGDKRMPKWRFRVAGNVIVQLQPRPVTVAPAGREQWALAFEGVAFVADHASAEWFERAPVGGDWGKLRFDWYATVADPSVWWLKPRGFRARETKARDGYAWSAGVYQAIAETLGAREFPVAALLVPQCLVCGKRLTDPASMARWVGPECAGTASLVVPRLLEATGEVA